MQKDGWKFYFINEIFMLTHALNKYTMQGFSNGHYVFIYIIFFICDRDCGGYTMHVCFAKWRIDEIAFSIASYEEGF